MFSSLLSAPCELKLHLLQHVVFLRPPTSRPSEDAPPTSTDEVARGLVELYVPHDRRIGGIRVKLRAVQSVAVLPDQRDLVNFAGATPIGWEDTVLMEKVVEIGLPASKSHATVPGDDSISSAERRGRSRQARSRLVTPVASQPGSPRISLDDAPPDYEEQEPSHNILPHNGSSSGGGFGSIVRALSRGRPTSRPSSRPNSRAVSRSASRAASRDPSPTRAVPVAEHESGASHTSVGSPRHAPNSSHGSPSAPIPLSRHATTAEEDTLSGHLSRTGLSRGRDAASGPHPHIGDRDDYFGLIPPSPSLTGRGRTGLHGSASPGPVGAQHRSITLSPSRGFGQRREESRVRLMGMTRRSARAPSVDAGGRSPASSSDEQDGLFLQKGVHGFEFAFIIPADSPPYERSPYGRVRYVVKATAFGAGRAKSNLEAWRDMFPVVNPSVDGGPVPLTVLYNDLHPTVGLLSIACTANNISVGGIFNVDIHSPTPPHDLMIYLVRVSVETTTELRTRKKGKQYVPTQRHKLFEKGWVPPRPNDPHGQGDGKRSEGLIRDPTRSGSRPDDAWTVQGVARMPNDNIVRSTTTSGTRASIRFSHQLLVEVVHSRAVASGGQERKIKVFALRQPITLPSCCVAYDAVVLPPYTPNDESSRPATMPYDIGTHGSGIEHAHHSANGTPAYESQRRRTTTSSRLQGPSHDLCVCGQSFDDLSERERNLMIPARPYGELPLDGLSHRKIGELPDQPTGSRSFGGIGSALRRSTSRSSSTSRDSRDRSRSRHTINLRRSLSRVRSPSVGSTGSRRGRASSVTRSSGGRGGAGSAMGVYANGSGERGEGVIRTTSRGSRSDEVPGEAQGHYVPGITAAPPTYENVVEEDSGEEDGDEEERPNTAQSRRHPIIPSENGAARNGVRQYSKTPENGESGSASSTTNHHDGSSLSSGAAADDERGARLATEDAGDSGREGRANDGP